MRFPPTLPFVRRDEQQAPTPSQRTVLGSGQLVRSSDLFESGNSVTQAQDALNQELPAGLPTLAIDVNNSHSCCGVIKGPHAPH
jgi:hypothetical protein